MLRKEEQEHGQGAAEVDKMRLHVPLKVLPENTLGARWGAGKDERGLRKIPAETIQNKVLCNIISETVLQLHNTDNWGYWLAAFPKFLRLSHRLPGGTVLLPSEF